MNTPDNKPSTVGAAVASSAQPKLFPNGPEAGSEGAPLAKAQHAADNAHDAVDRGAQAGDDFFRLLVEGAHAAIDKLADVAGPTVDRIAAAFSKPSGKASSAGQSDDERGTWLSDVKDIAREHPIATVAVALAAGAIYMKLTATPSRDPRHGLDD